ncbi:unnamed protein product, partial [Porites evermanni]
EFKAFFLCFAVFVVITSGATLFKWEADEKKGTTSEYKVEVKDGNKEVNETIKIDTGKKTETVHISSEGRGAGKVGILFDFKQNIAMYRLSKSKACFLSDSTGNQLKPADLKKLLEMVSDKGKIQGKTEYVVVGTLDDRSFLSDEMATMCTKLPIYHIKQKNPKV